MSNNIVKPRRPCYNQPVNWNLLGHDWAVEILSRHIATHNTRHAYLFTGPDGVGRRTLAIRFSQALNCSQPVEPGVPCFACKNCTQTGAMAHPDLAIVQSEHKGATLKVDQVREMQHGLSLAAYQAQYRVAILLRFEEANDNAANALLKTLEEPPDNVVLILTANNADALLPTISSRCEVLNLRPMPAHALADGLVTSYGVDPEKAVLLAAISNGCPGLAIRYSQGGELLDQRKQILDEHLHLLESDKVERFKYAEALAKNRDKEAIFDVLSAWLSLWRDALLRSAGASGEISNPDYAAQIRQISTQLDLPAIHRQIDAIRKTYDLINMNANLRLALEVLMLDLPRLDGG
jgi:DNA polymerase-3 subunit delta'